MPEQTPIPDAAPEHEPEYVGAYSEPTVEYCCNYVGEYIEDVERCPNDASHTVVMRTPTDDLQEIAMCDDCGEPEDARRG